MFSTIGLCANDQSHFWRESLLDAGVTTIVDTKLGGTCTQSVNAWVVVMGLNDDPLDYAYWIRSLSAAVIVITPRTVTMQNLARQLPKVAFVCHPLRAELGFATLLLLTTRRTGGCSVMHAPLVRAVLTGVQPSWQR